VLQLVGPGYSSPYRSTNRTGPRRGRVTRPIGGRT
jgi:hypothetical protein